MTKSAVVCLVAAAVLASSAWATPPSEPAAAAATVVPAAPPRQKLIAVAAIKFDESAGVAGSLNPRVLVNLRKNLVTEFVKTRKFAVLDREFGDQIAAEKRTSEADRSEAGRTAKLGEEATADYMLSVAVKRFNDARDEQVMRLSGRKVPKYFYELSVAVQVIDVASRRVVFADSFDETASGVAQGVVTDFELWADGAAANIATRACHTVLELVYPLKVAAVTESGEVVLNEGAGRVAEGDSFSVYSLGKALHDPDTGVEIGREETLQGRVVVVRVLPKAAYAQVETPAGAAILPGSICRKVPKPVEIESPRPVEPPRAEKAKKIKVDEDI